jgi:hypothetical protein
MIPYYKTQKLRKKLRIKNQRILRISGVTQYQSTGSYLIISQGLKATQHCLLEKMFFNQLAIAGILKMKVREPSNMDRTDGSLGSNQ